jgi:hypothetical protein
MGGCFGVIWRLLGVRGWGIYEPAVEVEVVRRGDIRSWMKLDVCRGNSSGKLSFWEFWVHCSE